MNYRSISARIRGPLVPILAAFQEDDRLDIDSTSRWVDWLLSEGIGLFWTTQGTTHLMTLSDREVMDLTGALADVIRGRGLFIASTPWDWSTRQCMDFVGFAARCGVDAVKLQIGWSWAPTDDQVIEHYQAVAAVSELPLLAYTLGKPGVSNELLRRIIEIPQFVGMKNDTDDFYRHEHYLRTVCSYSDPSEFVVMTGGGLSSVFFGYEFGVKAYGDTTAWYDPQRSLEFHRYMESGARGSALQFIKEFDEPVRQQWDSLGAGMQWPWGHAALRILGHFRSDRMRFPLRALDAAQVAVVKEFLDSRGLSGTSIAPSVDVPTR